VRAQPQWIFGPLATNVFVMGRIRKTNLGVDPMRPRDLSADLRELLVNDSNLDAALATLRANGASIVECIIAVRSVRGHDLAEAKRVVHFSPAWADMRAQNEQLHAELEAAAREYDDGHDS
jgi:hypothetical protein